MRGRRGNEGRARRAQSADQRQGNAALIHVMRAWEALSEAEYLAWNVAGKTRRKDGINYFKEINLRRVGRGEELAPKSSPKESKTRFCSMKGWFSLCVPT
jgi:hypothetical protein